eukprot:6181192-Pleurochrysis_carterae.AAC.1
MSMRAADVTSCKQEQTHRSAQVRASSFDSCAEFGFGKHRSVTPRPAYSRARNQRQRHIRRKCGHCSCPIRDLHRHAHIARRRLSVSRCGRLCGLGA